MSRQPLATAAAVLDTIATWSTGRTAVLAIDEVGRITGRDNAGQIVIRTQIEGEGFTAPTAAQVQELRRAAEMEGLAIRLSRRAERQFK